MSSEYDARRQGWRLACGDSCVLRYDGRSVECVLVDLSVSGVLVSCDDGAALDLQPGDRCGLLLNGNPQHCTKEVPCTVTRREASRVGLQFPNDA